MDNKGIGSIELIFTTIFFIFICTGLVSVISDRLEMVDNTEELLEARMLIETVACSINSVYSAGNGQIKYITLPQTVGNSSYNLLVNSSGIYIEYLGMKGKADIFSMIIVDGLSNDSKTIEMVPGETYCIKNDKIYNTSVVSISRK